MKAQYENGSDKRKSKTNLKDFIEDMKNGKIKNIHYINLNYLPDIIINLPRITFTDERDDK